MIDTNANAPNAETIHSGLYGGHSLGMAGAALFETLDRRPAEVGLSGQSAAREIAGDQPAADDGNGLADCLSLNHAYEHTAHEFEQSSGQESGRAGLRLIAQNALMKMSTAEIMEKLHTHTGWSWRAIADFLEVSPNTPQNWHKGGGARGDNLQSAATKLRLSTDQMLGRADIPKDFLDHIDKKKPPRPSRRSGERLYTQSELDAILKADRAKRGVM